MTEYGSGLFLAPFKIVITALVTFPENQNLSLEDTGRGETNPSQILAGCLEPNWHLGPKELAKVCFWEPQEVRRKLLSAPHETLLWPVERSISLWICWFPKIINFQTRIQLHWDTHNQSSSNRREPINLLISNRNKMPISLCSRFTKWVCTWELNGGTPPSHLSLEYFCKKEYFMGHNSSLFSSLTFSRLKSCPKTSVNLSNPLSVTLSLSRGTKTQQASNYKHYLWKLKFYQCHCHYTRTQVDFLSLLKSGLILFAV